MSESKNYKYVSFIGVVDDRVISCFIDEISYNNIIEPAVVSRGAHVWKKS